MKCLWCTMIVLAVMQNLRVQFARDILDQRAAEKNIQGLDAVADREHWLVFRQAIVEQSEIDSFAIPVRVGRFRMPRGVEKRGLNVGRTPGENDRIEGSDKFLDFLRRQR